MVVVVVVVVVLGVVVGNMGGATYSSIVLFQFCTDAWVKLSVTCSNGAFSSFSGVAVFRVVAMVEVVVVVATAAAEVVNSALSSIFFM